MGFFSLLLQANWANNDVISIKDIDLVIFPLYIIINLNICTADSKGNSGLLFGMEAT